MIRRSGWCLVLFAFVTFASPSTADQFEQLDGPWLSKALKGADLTSRNTLSLADIGAMPALLKDTRSALVLAKTDQGNPVRLLIVPELRKPGAGKGDPIPVVVLERLDSFDSGEPTSRLASRKDIVIFDGFQVDLDTGQVVPEGQGGDVIFRINGEAGPRLETIGSARLLTMTRAPVFDTSKIPQPTPGKTVLPGDFAGRYRLFANGQWSGTLDLKVEGRGVVTGQFRSDLHGTTYPVTGQVATDVAHKLLFAIKYPRARQEFEGYLWAEGKGAMAGVASIAERPVGFFAIREGSRFAPEGTDIGPLAKVGKDQEGEHVVEILADKITLDGKAATLDDLASFLKPLVEDESKPSPTLLIRVSPDEKYSDVLRTIEAIQMAGVRKIRFESLEKGK
jgi:hypothetical protein